MSQIIEFIKYNNTDELGECTMSQKKGEKNKGKNKIHIHEDTSEKSPSKNDNKAKKIEITANMITIVVGVIGLLGTLGTAVGLYIDLRVKITQIETISETSDFNLVIENSINNSLNPFKEKINDDLSELKDEIKNDIHTLDNYIVELQAIHKIHRYTKIDDPDETVVKAVNNLSSLELAMESSKDSIYSVSSGTIGKNFETGLVLTYESTQNQTIIISYKDSLTGEDIFFKGKFDKNGYWDGNCIINRYRDGKLTLIMDAEYNSGKLISYKQVFSYEKSYLGVKYDVWAIAEREPQNEADSGFTWTYFKLREFEQKFETDMVVDIDVLNVDEFAAQEPLLREGYYSGYTSDGFYNDITGKAYLVKYNEYGYVRYLYMGKVVDGYPYDDTGDAWCISLGYDTKHYYYYKGKFENEEDTNENQKRKTLDEINSIIAPYNFECEIKWIETEDT